MQQQGNPYICALNRLPQGKSEMHFTLGSDFLERYDCGDEILGLDGTADIEVNRTDDRWTMLFTIEGDMQVPCNLCLDPMTIPADAEYKLLVEYGDERSEGETDDADILVLPWQSSLDLGEIIRDTLLLSIPTTCEHDEGECNPQMRDLLDDYLTMSEEDDEE